MKYIDWTYNAIYFTIINYYDDCATMLAVIKLLKIMMKLLGTLSFELGEYFLFKSHFQPLVLLERLSIQRYYIKKSKKELSSGATGSQSLRRTTDEM